MYQNEKKKIIRRGSTLAVCGFILMIIAAYITNFSAKSFLSNTLLVLVEPSGWFLVWAGMDHIFYIARKKNPDYEFNQRMAHAEIVFLSF